MNVPIRLELLINNRKTSKADEKKEIVEHIDRFRRYSSWYASNSTVALLQMHH